MYMVIHMDNIIKLLNKEIIKEEEIIKSLSVKQRDIKHIYASLIPNKNKRSVIKLQKLNDEETFYEFINILAYYNSVLCEKLAEVSKRANEYEENNLTYYKKNKNLNNVTLMNKINNISKAVQEEEEINRQMRDIMTLSLNFIVEFYEGIEKEKEEKKSLKKRAEYAFRNIRNNLTLTLADINTITLLIEKEEHLDKEALFNELNSYIESKKSIQTKKPAKESITSENKKYVDDNKQVITIEPQIKKNPIILNYLTTIRAFGDNKKAIEEFLNAISYNDDIDNIISEILLEIDCDKESNLYGVVSNYMVQMADDEFKDDKLLGDEQVNILFYDFINNPDKMINIIDKKIPNEDYKALLKAMELLKKDGAASNRTTTVLLKKIYKLRVDKVRVTFKRLNHNTYIILGIFRKRNQHGSEVIAKTKSRDDKLLMYEKSLIESANIPEIWNSYLEINEEIYKNVIEKIKMDKNNKHKKS